MSQFHPIEAIEAQLPSLRKLRIVAVVEFAKAIAVVVAGIGLLNAGAGALEAGARALLHVASLDPARAIGGGLLALARDGDRHPSMLLAVLGAYAAARVAEASGLWFGRGWARWFGLVSAGLFVPFELAYLAHEPSAGGAVVLAINLGVMWLLWPPSAAAD